MWAWKKTRLISPVSLEHRTRYALPRDFAGWWVSTWTVKVAIIPSGVSYNGQVKRRSRMPMGRWNKRSRMRGMDSPALAVAAGKRRVSVRAVASPTPFTRLTPENIKNRDS